MRYFGLTLMFSVFATQAMAKPPSGFEPTTSSGIIFEVKETGFVCGDEGAIMTLKREADGVYAQVKSARAFMNPDGPVRLQMLQPGKWQPIAMTCHHSLAIPLNTVVATFDLTRDDLPLSNFGPFEVKAGEVVYPGSFEAYDPATRRMARQYPSADGEFRLLDESGKQFSKVEKKYPELATRWVVRLAQPKKD